MIHYLYREQIISAPLQLLWKYFSEPKNLDPLTYRVEFLRGVKSLWLTEIAHVRENEYFVDEQRVGPYRFWYHEHIFESVKNGVKMTDHVTYAAPFGFLGDIVHAVWIRQRLKAFFDFRYQKISEIFGSVK